MSEKSERPPRKPIAMATYQAVPHIVAEAIMGWHMPTHDMSFYSDSFLFDHEVKNRIILFFTALTYMNLDRIFPSQEDLERENITSLPLPEWEIKLKELLKEFLQKFHETIPYIEGRGIIINDKIAEMRKRKAEEWAETMKEIMDNCNPPTSDSLLPPGVG